MPFTPAVAYGGINNIILFLQIRSNVIAKSSHGHLKNGPTRLLLGLLGEWILIIILRVHVYYDLHLKKTYLYHNIISYFTPLTHAS